MLHCTPFSLYVDLWKDCNMMELDQNIYRKSGYYLKT